jgi:hypothetical protein
MPGWTNVRSFWKADAAVPVRDLSELARGVIPEDQARTCPATPDPRICPSGWLPVAPQRVACAEALLNRTTGEWMCVRTGARCGGDGQPPCTIPPVLTTWIEDFATGVTRANVTPGGEVVTPLAAAQGVSPGATGRGPLLWVALGVLVFLVLGRRR